MSRLLELGAMLLAFQPEPVARREHAARPRGKDSATAVAGARYQAGGLGRFFLGDTYRDLWTKPIAVPVLDLRRFGGGLIPTKAGGGNQTKSLRFEARDGREYVFRFVDKDKLTIPAGFKGTVIHGIARDQVSAHHPAAAVVAAPLLEAAGVLHPAPVLMVMPDDSLLGEFRKEFAGELGTIEEYPTMPDDGPGFEGAADVIESEELRERLDNDPSVRIDTRAYLTARLMDAFLNDWDRHPGNWKWAWMGSASAGRWVPIARDRDKVLISYGGIVAFAGKFAPNLMTFSESYPSVRGLTWNSRELDRRLLIGAPRTMWDSVAATLRAKITDRVIDRAVGAMPAEYQHTVPELAARLKVRRDALPDIASRLYRYLAADPDIHATDAEDRATVVRLDDGSVEVRLQSGSDAPWLRRRFDPTETDEIRVYLHGGDDRAVVTGDVARSLRVRIIGGNGTNELIDSSRVAGRAGQARFYDQGRAMEVGYGPDTLLDRRPWVPASQGLVRPGRDRGSVMAPLVGVSAPGDLGLLVRFGVTQSQFGFRTRPYAGRTLISAEYATGVDAWRLTGSVDRRREGSQLHLTTRARMSEFEVIAFHGLGNATAEGLAGFFQVRQRQWLLQPALAYALDTRSDISFGPVIQYSTTETPVNTFIANSRPYGSGEFGQAGLRLGLFVDRRDQIREPRSGVLLDLSGTWYPGVWDVQQAFGAVGGAATVYHTLNVPLRPILVVRAHAKKVFGEFPFQESAFLGGRGTVRKLDLQRYAGDAAVGGTTELQVPLGRIPLVLPLVVGVYGFADAGRVFLDGNSPGGWHTGTGVGFWVGILNPSSAISAEVGNGKGRSLFRVRTGLSF